MDFHIIPYIEIDGIRTFTDSQIKSMFDQMTMDGTVRATFYQGDAQSREDFLRMMRNPANHLYVIMCDDSIAGIFWMNNFMNHIAHLHFCIFSPYWKYTDEAFQASHKALRSMKDKDGNPTFTRCIGHTPVWNKKALRAMAHNGWTIVGTVPDLCWDAKNGKSVDGVISYL